MVLPQADNAAQRAFRSLRDQGASEYVAEQWVRTLEALWSGRLSRPGPMNSYSALVFEDTPQKFQWWCSNLPDLEVHW